MSFITNYRRDAKFCRDMNKAVMTAGLDALEKVDGTAESRKRLTDEMKNMLNSNAELETTNCQLEYASGKFIGVIMGGASVIGGYLVGKFIGRLITK